MGMPTPDKAQFLVRTSAGLDYARVEPWEGGVEAAKEGAKQIGGYVMELDDGLCTTGKILADYR